MPNTVAADAPLNHELELAAIRVAIKARSAQALADLDASLDRGVSFEKAQETLKNYRHEKKSLSEKVDETLAQGRRVSFVSTGLHRDRLSPLELAEQIYKNL